LVINQYNTVAKASRRRKNTPIKKLKYAHVRVNKKIMLTRIQIESKNSTAAFAHCFNNHGNHTI
jgi:hypothetical protein